jgi:hypothetical protein
VSELSDEHRPSTVSGRPIVLVLMLCILGGTAASVYFFARSEHLYDPGTIAKANLVELGRALAAYDTKHGSMPPAILDSADGNPAQSWRVLLLPFLPDEDSRRLAQQYRLNEPWDSEFNARLTADRMPLMYHAKPPDPRKIRTDESRGRTRFVAITGDGTLWQADDTLSMTTKEPRILLVEYFGEDIRWTEPRDITIESLDGSKTLMELGLANDRGPGLALYSDGSVVALPMDETPESLARMARGH